MTTTMYIRRGQTLHRMTFTCNAETLARIRRLKASYTEILGKPVSGSILIRRGLALLEERLAAVSDGTDAGREALAVQRVAG